MTRIQPFSTYVIVKMDKSEEKTAGGLYIPEKAKLLKKTGTVMAVGRGLITENGTIVPLESKVGDRVYVIGEHFKEIEYEGEACVVLANESLILGRIEGEFVEGVVVQ